MDDLDRLFAEYRTSLPDPDLSAGFVPGVWQRIESRRSPARFLRRMTEALVAMTAVAVILMGAVVIPRLQTSHVYNASYIDVLADEQASDTVAYAAVAHHEPPMDHPTR